MQINDEKPKQDAPPPPPPRPPLFSSLGYLIFLGVVIVEALMVYMIANYVVRQNAEAEDRPEHEVLRNGPVEGMQYFTVGEAEVGYNLPGGAVKYLRITVALGVSQEDREAVSQAVDRIRPKLVHEIRTAMQGERYPEISESVSAQENLRRKIHDILNEILDGKVVDVVFDSLRTYG